MSENKEKQQVEEKNEDISFLGLLLVLGIPFFILGLVFKYLPDQETFGQMSKVFLIISYVVLGLASLVLIFKLSVKLYDLFKSGMIDKNKIIWGGIAIIVISGFMIDKLFFKNTTSFQKNVWCGQYLSYGTTMSGKPDTMGAIYIAKEDIARGGSQLCGVILNKYSSAVTIFFPNENIANQWGAYDKQTIIIKGTLENNPYNSKNDSYILYNPRF